MAADKNTVVTHHADGTQTTEVVDWTPEELAAHAEAEANAWKGARIAAYPSWQDQLDMQYWDSVNNTSTWADAIAKVKADNPKGDA
jgi:hypothetical protein|tara:strand:+ start:232 stop:489 length:258 start_codon:yes stop_codon:yes gene_type:complete